MSCDPMNLVIEAREYLFGRYDVDPDGEDVKLIQRFQNLVIDQFRVIDFMAKTHKPIAEGDGTVCGICATAWPCHVGNALNVFGVRDDG